jgi:hypothetical protein
MKKQIKKADPDITWNGMECTIVDHEPVVQSNGKVKMCCKIKIAGKPLHQALRLVDESELVVRRD